MCQCPRRVRVVGGSPGTRPLALCWPRVSRQPGSVPRHRGWRLPGLWSLGWFPSEGFVGVTAQSPSLPEGARQLVGAVLPHLSLDGGVGRPQSWQALVLPAPSRLPVPSWVASRLP